MPPTRPRVLAHVQLLNVSYDRCPSLISVHYPNLISNLMVISARSYLNEQLEAMSQQVQIEYYCDLEN